MSFPHLQIWIRICVHLLLFITLGVHSSKFDVNPVTDDISRLSVLVRRTRCCCALHSVTVEGRVTFFMLCCSSLCSTGRTVRRIIIENHTHKAVPLLVIAGIDEGNSPMRQIHSSDSVVHLQIGQFSPFWQRKLFLFPLENRTCRFNPLTLFLVFFFAFSSEKQHS